MDEKKVQTPAKVWHEVRALIPAKVGLIPLSNEIPMEFDLSAPIEIGGKAFSRVAAIDTGNKGDVRVNVGDTVLVGAVGWDGKQKLPLALVYTKAPKHLDVALALLYVSRHAAGKNASELLVNIVQLLPDKAVAGQITVWGSDRKGGLRRFDGGENERIMFTSEGADRHERRSPAKGLYLWGPADQLRDMGKFSQLWQWEFVEPVYDIRPLLLQLVAGAMNRPEDKPLQEAVLLIKEAWGVKGSIPSGWSKEMPASTNSGNGAGKAETPAEAKTPPANAPAAPTVPSANEIATATAPRMPAAPPAKPADPVATEVAKLLPNVDSETTAKVVEAVRPYFGKDPKKVQEFASKVLTGAGYKYDKKAGWVKK